MKYHNSWLVGSVFIVILFLVLLCLSPFITIWSLNTVFNLSIQTNIWTYLATLWLTGLVAGGNVGKK
jgi:ABC-type Fe3+ transport system permease subunit